MARLCVDARPDARADAPRRLLALVVSRSSSCLVESLCSGHGGAQGKAVYKLNRDWVEVEAGDFMWLRAFCPQVGGR